MERVQKIIAHSGFCSRRKAEEFIERGKVLVNGQKIKLGDKAEWTDQITINNKTPNIQPGFVPEPAVSAL